ncbi:DUF6807 domain-containing protein [Paenibacillus mendelii]|uniref:PmoA family protein n=1 Tax=Paenibacillus mendelii TaxID=206163 RepID=A0ABV6JAG4_9BACL|nr:PmoA family protein [Paenibacillus mendelii]MCQ6560725.1 PmoA family protein [Paenibacillus mendelii]
MNDKAAGIQVLRVDSSAHQLALYRQGQDTPLLVQQAKPDHRPYIHPILAPDGIGVLTEDAPPHHPWQHGLYVGLNDVNGYGFWSEGLTDSPSDGTFHPIAISNVRSRENQASWTVTTQWREPGGELLLLERQHWTFSDNGTYYELDMEWTLQAELEIRFGVSPYGGLFLRMPYREELGGRFLNSEGMGLEEAEGQRARWGAVSMPIEGRDDSAGIAIMDHPGNEEHPSPWRVDYQFGIAPSRSIAGAWHLAQGQTATSRYRVYIFNGDINPAALESNWQRYSGRQES